MIDNTDKHVVQCESMGDCMNNITLLKNKIVTEDLGEVELTRNMIGSPILIVSFGNGYGCSVITGLGSYTNDECPYEIGIMKNMEPLCMELEITNNCCDEIIGFLTAEEVMGYLKYIATKQC